MSCYHPLRAVVLGTRDKHAINKETGKEDFNLPVVKHNVKVIKILGQDSNFEYENPDYEYINIPCGRCIGCRLAYSRVWADRCMAEASYYDNNLFITLTYDDDHLPDPFNYISETGEVKKSPVSPLDKRALQLFMKRLRKKVSDQKIRYFACGEYGGTNMRPHYHLIIFNLKLDDLQLLYRNDQSFRYFTSDLISSCWPFGFHIITSVNWQVCAYVARYIVKKQKGEGASIYEDYNFPPEFTLMSRKPGIGRQFYEDHKRELYQNEVYLSTEEGSRKIKPNRYYDSLYDIDYPDHMAGIREDRMRIAKVNESLKTNLTNLSFLDRLESEETVQAARIKSLKRGDL